MLFENKIFCLGHVNEAKFAIQNHKQKAKFLNFKVLAMTMNDRLSENMKIFLLLQLDFTQKKIEIIMQENDLFLRTQSVVFFSLRNKKGNWKNVNKTFFVELMEDLYLYSARNDNRKF